MNDIMWIVDHREQIEIKKDDFFNELVMLDTLGRGIWDLYAGVKKREDVYNEKNKHISVGHSFGRTPELERISCMFHWFGLSLCNYVRLVGFIRGNHLGLFKRSDLTDKKLARKAKSQIDDYVESVNEIKDAKVWRNKVFAHFAITDPREDDNMATLDMSVIFPVAYEINGDGRFVAGSMNLSYGNASGAIKADLPYWSLTRVFESVKNRYWPSFQLQANVS